MREHRRTFVVVALALFFFTVWPVHAQVVRQLTHSTREAFVSGPALDDAGDLVAAAISESTESNRYNEPRLYQWVFPGATRSEVYPFRVDAEVALSDDGQSYAFVSRDDLVGENPDGGFEIYVASADGGTIVQITDRSFGASKNVSLELAGAGTRLIYVDDSDPLGTNPAGLDQLFLAASDGSGIVQLTQVTDATTGFCGNSISDDGLRIVFSHDGDLTGDNPDAACQVFRVDPDGGPRSGCLDGGRRRSADAADRGCRG